LQQTPRVGLEPTSSNQQSLDNKELTKNTNPVLATSLDNLVQIYPDLVELVNAWPELPEQVKAAIKALVKTHSLNSERTGNRQQ